MFSSALLAKGTKMTDQPSQAVQDYLKAIHSLGGADGMVSPLGVAERLGVRAPSVTLSLIHI